MNRGVKKKTIVHGVNMPIVEHKLSGQETPSGKDSAQLSNKGMDSIQMNPRKDSNNNKSRGARKQTMKLANYRGGKKHTVLDKNFQPKKIDPNMLWQQAGYANSNQGDDKSIDTPNTYRNEQDSFNSVKKDAHSDRKNSEDVTNQKSDRILFDKNAQENTADKLKNKANPLVNKIVDDSVDLGDDM